MSLGRVTVAARRAGVAQGDPTGQLALRQRVADLLEVLAELVLAEGRLNTTSCPPRNEMASVLLLQLFYLREETRRTVGLTEHIKPVNEAQPTQRR